MSIGVWVCVCVTSTLCSSCSWLESSRTLTDVRPRCVQTFSMCTWLFVTFIIVWRRNVKLRDLSHLTETWHRRNACKDLPMHSPLTSSLNPMLHSQRYPAVPAIGIHLPFRHRLRKAWHMLVIFCVRTMPEKKEKHSQNYFTKKKVIKRH